MVDAIIDNDILFKGACYCLLQEFAGALNTTPGDCGILGAARFVVKHKIERAKLSKENKLALRNLDTFLSVAAVLEPVKTEQAFAARLEGHALRLGLGLDAGESQLCAMAIERVAPLFVTGDKRAIAAFEQLITLEPDIIQLCGKVMCLEQLVVLLLARITFGIVHDAVCLEPTVDKALAICFACLSGSKSEPRAKEGLESYIKYLRSTAERILAA